MKTFRLVRKEDVTGVSGAGHVADGVEFEDGTCVVRWRGESPTTMVHDNLVSIQRIHLHEGRTGLQWMKVTTVPSSRYGATPWKRRSRAC